MSNPPESNWAQKLRQVEEQLQGFSETATNSSSNSLLNTFHNLPVVGKIAAGLVVLVIGLMALQLAWKIFVSFVSLCLLIGIVYLGYRFFFNANAAN